MSRDFIIFIARKPIYNKQIQKVVELSPESLKRENIYNLAVETERTAQWGSSIRVWGTYLQQKGLSDSRQLEAKVRLAQAYYFKGQKRSASSTFTDALQGWKNGNYPC